MEVMAGATLVYGSAVTLCSGRGGNAAAVAACRGTDALHMVQSNQSDEGDKGDVMPPYISESVWTLCPGQNFTAARKFKSQCIIAGVPHTLVQDAEGNVEIVARAIPAKVCSPRD